MGLLEKGFGSAPPLQDSTSIHVPWFWRHHYLFSACFLWCISGYYQSYHVPPFSQCTWRNKYHLHHGWKQGATQSNYNYSEDGICVAVKMPYSALTNVSEMIRKPDSTTTARWFELTSTMRNKDSCAKLEIGSTSLESSPSYLTGPSWQLYQSSRLC